MLRTRWLFLASLAQLLAVLASALGQAEVVVPQVASHSLVALNTSAASKCAAGPLKVLVRISSCFALRDVEAIDKWVTSSLAGSTPPYYVDDVAVQAAYYARLENPVLGRLRIWHSADGCRNFQERTCGNDVRRPRRTAR